MLEIVYGQTKKQLIARQLVDALSGLNLDGTLYVGYPVLASADEKIEVDALLVSRQHGLVAFRLADASPRADENAAWERMREEQDKLYFAIANNLSRHNALRSGRELGVRVQTATVFPARPSPPQGMDGIYCDVDSLAANLNSLPPLEARFFAPLQAALQRVSTIKPVKKRARVAQERSRGAILQKIEQELANLDQWQKRAAIESPEGPQRIRGLAGSGKTVVLALKAAYLHAQHPDWVIAVTFHTRSLYQQIKDLIRRFSFEHLNDEPNWENLRVMHAWGSMERDGVYTEIARHCEVAPQDFLAGKSRYGMSDAFRGVCAELLSITASKTIEPIYHAVLVDEAQDLPPSFFQLVHRFTHPPKRIIWAYDELQRLSETTMPSTEELFGTNENGEARVRLSNEEGRPRQDIILPVCYRNTPWALTLAHALGFGTYRKGGLVQHFDEPGIWSEIGYHVVDGELQLGREVSLERNPGSYPSYFAELLSRDDAVVTQVFKDDLEQAEWLAASIKKNLQEDELDHDDILVILPDAYTAKRKSAVLIEALSRVGIEAHLAGVTSSRDQIFLKQSIAIANIYRSKGNEAPMVYVLNCQHCYSGHELITLRNILFTAITRCRAWVRLSGWGSEMVKLVEEINAVRRNEYRLRFKVPTAEELKKMRMIHRDRTVNEKARIKKVEQSLKELLEMVNRGELTIENLPPDLRTGLAQLLRAREENGDSSA